MLNYRSGLHYISIKQWQFWLMTRLCMDWHHLGRELQVILYSSREWVLSGHRVLHSKPQALKGFLAPWWLPWLFLTVLSSSVKMCLRAWFLARQLIPDDLGTWLLFSACMYVYWEPEFLCVSYPRCSFNSALFCWYWICISKMPYILENSNLLTGSRLLSNSGMD